MHVALTGGYAFKMQIATKLNKIRYSIPNFSGYTNLEPPPQFLGTNTFKIVDAQ